LAWQERGAVIQSIQTKMTINYYGHSCFRIANSGNHVTVVIDPYNKKTGLGSLKLSADILLISHDHGDHNEKKAISSQEAFLIDSPGEYEIKGVSIVGIPTFHDSSLGKERGGNTVYLVNMDNINLCHLGDLGQDKLSDKELEKLGQVDVLMVPVGGTYTIDAKGAAKLANQIEPRIVVPMHYKLPKTDASLKLAKVDGFLEEMGAEKKQVMEKLTVKKEILSKRDRSCCYENLD